MQVYVLVLSWFLCGQKQMLGIAKAGTLRKYLFDFWRHVSLSCGGAICMEFVLQISLAARIVHDMSLPHLSCLCMAMVMQANLAARVVALCLN